MKRLAASCFGLGRLPVAPGTWGSLPPALTFALMCHFGAGTAVTSIVMAVLALIGCVVCVRCAPAVIAATGETDPREVVADEFAGQALVFLAVPFLFTARPSTGQIWATVVLGFVLFRLFDIVKPWPIRRLEKLPEGWGILCDDLMAGVYAGLALLLCLQVGLVGYLSELFGFEGGSPNILEAALLGVVQGLTEFLPVSSSGHLVLFETFLNFDAEKPEMLLFDLGAHVGTVTAIFVVFRKSIAAFFKNLLGSGKYGIGPFEIYKKSPSGHLLVLAIFATFVTGVCGLWFESYFASARGSLGTVALMWFISGTLLMITDWRRKTRLGLRQFGLWHAAVVGLAQAAAIMPGISRSGATICVAILLGLRRRWAVEFSFLIAIPAILGAAAIKLVRDFGEISTGGLSISSLVTGSAVAALVGIFALKLLIKASRSANLRFFAFYCYLLACFVTVYLLKYG